ncbi:class I glutamine amidotransferase-like protein [Chaetomium sp. MPI-SDFR-AT-0129]|nr:class I glutamine amidotransferase-like protein [Chaetomium sp. MPI-SDFR-AT-0129]
MGSFPNPDPLRLAILLTDTPIPAISSRLGTFDTIFTTLLRTACETVDPSQPQHQNEPPQPLESQLILTAHDVIHPEAVYPDPGTIDAVLITGSRYTAYDDDEWIVRLTEYTRGLLEGGRVKVIGVCFGHQIVARALGGVVGPSAGGWEVAVTEVEVSEEGRWVLRTGECLNIYQSHRDAVLSHPCALPFNPSVPIVRLGSTASCHCQGMYAPGSLMTTQGHPEYTPFLMKTLLQTRHKLGVLPDAAFEDAMGRIKEKHDGLAVARAWLRFLRD